MFNKGDGLKEVVFPVCSINSDGIKTRRKAGKRAQDKGQDGNNRFQHSSGRLT